jgi:hypothetical protein
MHRDDLYSPNAAESYFNSSPFGQLYALLALTLGAIEPPRRRPTEAPAAARSAQRDASPRMKLLDRLDGWFWRQSQKERDAYLGASTDVFELERRIEALERGAIPRYY